MKHNFGKLLKNWQNLGKTLETKANEASGIVNGINSDTDLKIFIDENTTNEKF